MTHSSNNCLEMEKEDLRDTLNKVGVKTERIRMDSSETIFVNIFFSDSESERIVCGYEYGIGVYWKRIRIEYGANMVRLRINILSDLLLIIK
jgi:hypothetical protein